MLLLCTHCLYARALSPSFYTLIGSLSDDSEFVRLDIGGFILLFRCSMWEELEFPSTHSGIIVFLFISIDSVVSLILYTLLSVIIPFLIHMLSCVDAYI